MRTVAVAACIAVLLSAAAGLFADTLKLRDGTELAGKITKRTQAQVSIEVDGVNVDVELKEIDAINGEKIAHPEEEKVAVPEKLPEAEPVAKAGKRPKKVLDMLKNLETRPTAEVLAADAQAKRQVILKPDPDRVVNISDETFFGALDPKYPGMGPIVQAAKARRYEAAWKAWDDFARKKLKPAGELREVEDYRKRNGGKKPGATDEQADKVCDHVIRVWHSQVVDFGKEMDWTKVNGRSSLYGFHYWGWAAPLWTAYVYTGNEKYAAGFDEIFTSWYAQRAKVSAVVPTNDIIWYELGCGCRPMVFARLYYALLDSKSFRPETRKLVMKTLLGHANQLQAQQECGYTDGNFQLTASMALYQLGLIVPMFKDAAQWRETATARLLEHAYWDFFKDGCHSERCVGYGQISMRDVRQLLEYSEDDPAPSPLIEELRKKVLEMQLWFLRYVGPGGVFTGVNDSGFCAGESLLTDLAKFANDGRFLWPIRDSGRLPEGIKPKEPEFRSVHMPDSGWTFMRDGWDKESFYLQVNWGRYGGGHTHPALLDINAYAFGAPMVIETARFESYDNPLEPYFRSPEAHNEVAILDHKLDRPNNQGENVLWRSGKKIEYFEATHRGYEESAGKIIKRQILFAKGEYWLVLDTILNSKEKREGATDTPKAALNWHSPFPWKEGEGQLVAGAEGGPGVQLLVLPAGKAEFQTGYENTTEFYKSRYRAFYTQPAKNGVHFITLISPYKDKPGHCKLEMLSAELGCVAVRVTREGRTDSAAFAVTKKKGISAGELSTDGRAAWLREGNLAAAVVDGAKLTFNRQSVLKAKTEQEIAETR